MRIWAVRVADLRGWQRLLYRGSRVLYSGFQGFFSNRITVRAAALTYYSVLSIVPFLAFAFAILKGFGAYESFIEKSVRPYLHQTFGDNPALLGATEKILQFVQRTNFSTLGAVGLLILLYTSVSLLSSVEDTLNDIWGAKTRRTLLRQVTDYVTLLVTTPLLILAAGTAATAAQSSRVVEFLRDVSGIGAVIDFLLRFTSVAVVGVAFFALYLILPNVRTRRLSCAIGALVAAVLWQVALVLYVQLQVGVSSYNALYSVLSALPIFLVWTYVSWLVVLVGAQVAASHQNEGLVRQRLRAQQADQALRETLAVVVGAHVAREFLRGGPWRAQARLSELVDVPALAIEETLQALVRAGLLARADVGGAVGYLPGRDLDRIRVSDLKDALRMEPQADAVRAELEARLGPELARVLRGGEEDRRRSPHDVSLRELAGMVGDVDEGRAVAARTPPVAKAPPVATQRPVMDAK
ncbi:hypothetical protein AMPC_25580 [Anaeromyxobacter paludicola]|uniref:Uncharacterized protein n=1 Tax=Anaeromyxobacter paludicola TaxID=2918171 RepID=A0ABM7XC67_9BACT|nr:hypothetical protein AMPC_25580 [Anaeromyxobacter paludicola]